MTRIESLTTPPDDSGADQLAQLLDQALSQSGGWMGFDAFMALVLYTPGLGYYAHGSQKFGLMPYKQQAGVRIAGSDFATAPEISPQFGRALARQVTQAMHETQTREVWEFGAGSGALAEQLLQALGEQIERYTIVDLSGSLRLRQQQRLERFAHKVVWANVLPDVIHGVLLGNEVLDAMPVKLLSRVNGRWHERGVVRQGSSLAWQDRITDLRPPLEVEGEHDYLTEIHPQAEAFMVSLAERLVRGAAFFLDYGFPEHEYYHPQRHMGTVMCHRAHQADADPLSDLGSKDITAHVNFTALALAAQNAGLEVLGYTSQARFLLNCGLLDLLQEASMPERIHAQKLIMEHEMGELFKVIGFVQPAGISVNQVEPWQAIGFSAGDRTHTL